MHEIAGSEIHVSKTLLSINAGKHGNVSVTVGWLIKYIRYKQEHQMAISTSIIKREERFNNEINKYRY